MAKILNDTVWKAIPIAKLFKISGSKTTPKNELEKMGNGKYPYVTTQTTTNGQAGYYRTFTEKGGVLTVDSAVAGFCTYQANNFSASDHVEVLTPKFCMNKYIALFLTGQINKNNQNKFSYGYKACQDRLREMSIMLPVDFNDEPDYKFMEEYIKEREAKLKNHYKEYIQKHIDKLQKKADIKNKKWGNFKLSKIFSFDKGNQNNMGALQNGDIPLVSAKKVDNGYKNFVSKNNKKIFNGGCISLNNDGDGGAGIAYYQPYKMLLDSHCTALVSKLKLTKETLLFLSKSITKQRRKFGHGYAINKERLKAFQIMLPINSKGEPDYEFMHNYMLYLEQKKILEYLEYIDG